MQLHIELRISGSVPKPTYRKSKTRIVAQVERFYGTALEYLARRSNFASKRIVNGLLECFHDRCSLDHLPVDVVCKLHRNNKADLHCRTRTVNHERQQPPPYTSSSQSHTSSTWLQLDSRTYCPWTKCPLDRVPPPSQKYEPGDKIPHNVHC